jgi:hypothetical protein
VQEAVAALGMDSLLKPAGDLVPELASLDEQFRLSHGSPTQCGSCLRIVAKTDIFSLAKVHRSVLLVKTSVLSAAQQKALKCRRLQPRSAWSLLSRLLET